MNKLLVAAAIIAAPALSAAAVPYTFVSGQAISASQLNANFAYLDSKGGTGGPATGGLMSKVGAIPPAKGGGYALVTVIANQGTTTIAILEALGYGGGQAGFSWKVDCGAAGSFTFSPDKLRYLPGGCTLIAIAPPSTNVFNYSVTYQQ